MIEAVAPVTSKSSISNVSDDSLLPSSSPLEDVLDPDMPEAVANIPMPRKDVEKLMKERGLEKWVHAKLLDVLYDGLNERSGGGAAARGGGSVEMKQVAATPVTPAAAMV